MGYFVIGCSADGLTFDGPLSQDELEKRLNENYYGRAKFATRNPGTDGFCIQFGDDELMIVQGTIVVPEAKQSVTQWKVPQ